LETLGDALLRCGILDRARDILLRLPPGHPGGAAKLFELINRYLSAGPETEGIALLGKIQRQMVDARQESDFASRLDSLVAAFPSSIPLTEFWATAYAALRRDAKYFDALARLLDLYCQAEDFSAACEALEKMVEIDPYDPRAQRCIEDLDGHA